MECWCAAQIPAARLGVCGAEVRVSGFDARQRILQSMSIESGVAEDADGGWWAVVGCGLPHCREVRGGELICKQGAACLQLAIVPTEAARGLSRSEYAPAASAGATEGVYRFGLPVGSRRLASAVAVLAAPTRNGDALERRGQGQDEEKDVAQHIPPFSPLWHYSHPNNLL